MAYGYCFICHKYGIVERHHIFGGARRKMSERFNLKVNLCLEHHQYGPEAVHKCAGTAKTLHRYGQRKAMLEQGWTVEQFRVVFGCNYLDENEIREIYEEQRSGKKPSAFEPLEPAVSQPYRG